jgi:hypothetical protein
LGTQADRRRSSNYGALDGEDPAVTSHARKGGVRTFVEHQIQPLAAWAHCMWDYNDRRDSTRFTSNELKEAKIDDGVRAINSLTKKTAMPKNFGT